MKKPRMVLTVLILGALLVQVLPMMSLSLADGEPTVVTDKADYSPGETVTVFGSGFTPDMDYDVPVVRPDGIVPARLDAKGRPLAADGRVDDCNMDCSVGEIVKRAG